MRMRKILHLIILLPFLILPLFFLQPTATSAAPESANQIPLSQPPKLQLPIPSAPQFSNLEFEGPEEQRYLLIPWIAQYIGAIYRYALSLVGIVVVTVIVYGGMRWLTAAGDPGKITEAKKIINNAVIGLLLTLGIALILNVINPEILRFRALKIAFIVRGNLAAVESEEAAEVPATPPGTMEPTIFVRKTQFMANGFTVAASLADTLRNIAEELYRETASLPNGPFKLAGGGFRSLDDQVAMWVSRCEGRPRCSIPTCNPFPRDKIDANLRRLPGAQPDARLCPHTTGIAIDIACKKSPDTSKIDSVPCQLALERIMLRKGFCRLRSEPWHFERPKLMSTCTSEPDKVIGTAFRSQTNETWNYAACPGDYSLRNKRCL